MFDALTRYLFEYKRLTIPQIGVFELQSAGANANRAEQTLLPPGWSVVFIAASDAVIEEPDAFYNWLAQNQHISREQAVADFESFVQAMNEKLDSGEKISWNGVGQLVKEEGKVVFIAEQEKLSPFTQVTARKVIRKNTNFATIVGDRETTSAEMREELFQRQNPTRNRNRALWILFTVAVIAAAWYFSQYGCNPQGTGNKQKVKATVPAETYSIQ